MVKQLLLVVSILYTITLIVLSLINIDNMPDLGSSMDDKIFHVIAYLILSVLWITYVKPLNNKRLITVAILGSIGLGVLMEVMQYLFNPNRSFDVFDMLANTLGVFIGTLIAVRYTLLKLK